MVGAQAYGIVEKYGNLLRLLATKFLSFVFFPVGLIQRQPISNKLHPDDCMPHQTGGQGQPCIS
jgi:hypothetical protein